MTRPQETEEALRRLIEMRRKIRAFGDLPEDWNGVDAAPIDPAAIRHALEAAFPLDELYADKLRVAPTAIGGIRFDAHPKGLYVGIVISPAGEASE